MKEDVYANIFTKYLEDVVIKSDEILAKRDEQLRMCTEWATEQLSQDVHPAGTMEDIPKIFSIYSDPYQPIRECVFKRDDHKCRICGAHAQSVHHIRPRQFGGKNHPRNLISLCRECHAEVHYIIDNEIMEAFIKAIYRGNMYKDNMKKISEKYGLGELME